MSTDADAQAEAPPRGRVSRMAVYSVLSSLVGVVVAPMALLGVGLGVIAYTRLPATGLRGRVLALAGIACGALSLLINLFLVVLVLGGQAPATGHAG
ncbi:MAG: hypothetical protein P4L86_33210 [Mycobacterium sp.]|nr:hypothetical protein [Mycobacterium sp.]